MDQVRSGLLLLAVLAMAAHGQTPGTIVSRAAPSFPQSVMDSAGNLYSAGGNSTQYAVTPGAAQTQSGGGLCSSSSIGIGGGPLPGPPVPCSDAFVLKVDPAGKTVFATYLGGPANDFASRLALDSTGAVYVAGTTGGSFPTTPNAALATLPAAGTFAVKLNGDGSKILYSTYLPASMTGASGIAVDGQGNAYITGKSAAGHVAVVKLTADGSTFAYYRELAGSRQDVSTAITVDSSGNVLVTGYTTSADFPVSAGALQPHLQGLENCFVVELDGAGNPVFSTYLGGSGSDSANCVQIDAAGAIYLAGSTTSLDFPTTPGTFQPLPLVPMWAMSPGGFVAKLAPGGGSVDWSTYVPGKAIGLMAVNSASEVYLVGTTGAGFPVTASSPQACFGGSTDIFVAHLDSRGALQDATYLGGPGDDNPYSLAIASDGSVLLSARLTVSGGDSDFSLTQLRFGSAGWSAPACLSPDLLNAAILSASQRVAPGQIATLTGVGIGPAIGVTYQPGPQGEAPLSLAGVQVFIGGLPAPVIYAQAEQINVLVPFELSLPPIGPASEHATTTFSLNYNKATFGPFEAPVFYGNPAFFRLQPGISTQAAAVNQDGTINSPQHPASAGSVVSLFGTGFGAGCWCSTGALNPPVAEKLTSSGIQVLINGGPLALYAGSAPSLLCGVTQVNMVVPAGTPPGNFQVAPWWLLTVGSGDVEVQNAVGATIVVK